MKRKRKGKEKREERKRKDRREGKDERRSIILKLTNLHLHLLNGT